MKKCIASVICGLLVLTAASRSVSAETEDATNSNPVRKLWKSVVIDEGRDYDRLLASAQRIIKEKHGTADALTAEFLLGRIHMDQASNEVSETLDKARTVFEELAKRNPETWQGQAARISLINILQVEGRHSEVITASAKGLKEINWNLLGRNAPPDLADYRKLAGAEAEFTPDVLRMFLARSYFEQGKADQAKQWAMKIDDAEMKKETLEAIAGR